MRYTKSGKSVCTAILLIITVNSLNLKKVIDEIIADFDAIEIDETVKKPKVGVVGEILVKFHP